VAITVYGLSDISGVRYVGVTTRDIDKRLTAHITESNRTDGTHKRHWLRQALDAGPIEVEQLDDAPTSADALWLERLWIAVFRACGIRLTNGNDGGRGCLNPTPATREKLRCSLRNVASARNKRMWAKASDDERTARLVGFDPMAFAGRTHTDKTREEMSRKQTAAWLKRDKVAHALKTLGATPEERSVRARRAANARWKR
jgi:hypothetical protein